MTPKEKAVELFNRMKTCTECKCYSWDDDNARKSALICVDEIMNIKSVYHDETLSDYWNEVKTEITNL